MCSAHINQSLPEVIYNIKYRWFYSFLMKLILKSLGHGYWMPCREWTTTLPFAVEINKNHFQFILKLVKNILSMTMNKQCGKNNTKTAFVQHKLEKAELPSTGWYESLQPRSECSKIFKKTLFFLTFLNVSTL